MSRPLGTKQTSLRNWRVASSENPVKKRATRASKRSQEQDENTVPQIKTTSGKLNVNRSVSNLKLDFSKNQLKNKTSTLSAKSPALRDRTNTSSDDVKPVLVLSKMPSKTKQKVTSKKLETIFMSSKKLSTRSNSKDNLESFKRRQIFKETEITSLTSSERLKGEEAPETRSETGTVKENNVQGIPVPETKKFFKSRNHNQLTTCTGQEAIKKATKKRKIARKTKDDSSFNIPLITSEVKSQSRLKTLRPRQTAKKNYCLESSLLERLSPEKRNSMVVIEKLSDPAKKLPIWRSVQLIETESKGKDVYDISLSDLSSDNPRPKKKRKVSRKPTKRLNYAVLEKKVKEKKVVKFRKLPEILEQVAKKSDAPKLNPQGQTKPQIISKELLDNVNPRKLPEISGQIPKKPDVPKLEAQGQLKPKIISSEILDNVQKINTLPTSPAVEEFRPFRVTQFSQPRNTMKTNMSDHSLLTKSMSPISKVTEAINFNTPWRIPPVEGFSCVRNLAQSTPHQNKNTREWIQTHSESLTRKGILANRPEEKGIEEGKLDNIRETSSNGKSRDDELSPEVSSGNQETVPMINSIASTINNATFDDTDKENAAPNIQSPGKMRSNENNSLETPTFQPQPGVSGLQKAPSRNTLSATKVLQQTNLNHFLALDGTPERTQIRTPHGIFNDIHSTPIYSKPLKKISEPNIQNAFGFDEDDINVSPILSENAKPIGVLREKGAVRGKAEENSISKNPVRLNRKEILKTMHQRRIKEAASEKKEGNIVNLKVDQLGGEIEKEKNKQKENIATDFSNTFDLLNKENEVRNEQTGGNESDSIHLFEDLEPTHFITPPKHIYKRKRDVRFSVSEDSDNEKNDNVEEGVKRKSKKANKEDKKMKEWAENINKTFEEIDSFDLIVEKHSK